VNQARPDYIGTNAVQVVVEGYVRIRSSDVLEATSTCTLITVSNTGRATRVLVDPGSNRRLLSGNLHRLGIEPPAIDYVFLTHHHLDHTMNVALFPNAKVVIEGALFDQGRMMPLAGTIPGTEVEVLPTPGHSPDHTALVVPTPEGTVVIAGDVFWWVDDQPQTLDPDLPDRFATDPAQLRRSRQLVLARADWIVPGHGPMLPVAPPDGVAPQR
jgi:glyoxylase-like metal-dependent hydrolase (beta-lactamase superfamily II)